MATKRLIAGCMTGTSIDGIDAALVEVTGRGLAMEASIVRTVSRPLGGSAEGLRRFATGEPASARQIATLAREFALLHLDALRELIGDAKVDLVAIHEQSVFHDPPISWQLIQPAPIASGLGVPVVFDLRAADLAAGGQGAPITPLADYVLFRHPCESRAIVNLGGFCNDTILPAATGPIESQIGSIRGGDVCACNQLLDAVARTLLDCPFDADGQHAATGRVQPGPRQALDELLGEQTASGRSLGTGDELGEWIERYRREFSGSDLARTACEAVADTIRRQVRDADRVLVAGGGVRNRVLLAALSAPGGPPVELTDDRGVPADYREAVCFAVLGALCLDGVPITLPRVTGVGAPPIAGAWVHP